MSDNQTILSKLEDVIKQEESSKKESFKGLLSANNLYDKMLQSGVIKKRGYTLRGVEDIHLFRSTLNKLPSSSK